jgi:hypothetical protein
VEALVEKRQRDRPKNNGRIILKLISNMCPVLCISNAGNCDSNAVNVRFLL